MSSKIAFHKLNNRNVITNIIVQFSSIHSNFWNYCSICFEITVGGHTTFQVYNHAYVTSSSSLYVELNKVNGSILVAENKISTYTNLQVISSWLRKFPWEVWGITACTLKSTTILSIPQLVIRVENSLPVTSTKSWLTVVVRAHKTWRRWSPPVHGQSYPTVLYSYNPAAYVQMCFFGLAPWVMLTPST